MVDDGERCLQACQTQLQDRNSEKDRQSGSWDSSSTTELDDQRQQVYVEKESVYELTVAKIAHL